MRKTVKDWISSNNTVNNQLETLKKGALTLGAISILASSSLAGANPQMIMLRTGTDQAAVAVVPEGEAWEALLSDPTTMKVEGEASTLVRRAATVSQGKLGRVFHSFLAASSELAGKFFDREVEAPSNKIRVFENGSVKEFETIDELKKELGTVEPLKVSDYFLPEFGGMYMPGQLDEANYKELVKFTNSDQKFADLTDLNSGYLRSIISLASGARSFCSGAFVSKNGLILSNHHCVRSWLLQAAILNGEDFDTMGIHPKNGEVKVPGANILVTRGFEDVSERILSQVASVENPAERIKVAERLKFEIVEECEAAGGMRCDIYTFSNGSEYILLKREVIEDVRLVAVPQKQLGAYDETSGNWNFVHPEINSYRTAVDFGMVRAYGKDGKPFESKDFLKPSLDIPKNGQPYVIAGTPGSTNRMLTLKETLTVVAETLPDRVAYLTKYAEFYEDMADEFEERAEEGLAQLQVATQKVTGLKNYRQKFEAITPENKAELVQWKTTFENDLKEWMNQSPERIEKYGDIIPAIEDLAEQAQELDQANYSEVINNSKLLSSAITILKNAQNKAISDAERDNGYHERDQKNLKRAQQTLQNSLDSEIEMRALTFAIKEVLGEDGNDWVFQAFGISSIEEVDAKVKEVVESAKLMSLEKRLELLGASVEELASLNGYPFIDIALNMEGMLEEARLKGKAIAGTRMLLQPRYFELLEDFTATSVPHNANGSLRVVFGFVKPEPGDERISSHFGDLAENARRLGDDNSEFQVPQYEGFNFWERYERMLNGPLVAGNPENATIDFVGTGDITNGNSGSSVVWNNELLGLVFDGIKRFGDAGLETYMFRSGTSRVVTVSTRAIALTLKYFLDDGEDILREMGINPEEI